MTKRGAWDVVVIGSGIAGLTCAALLSKFGKSVCVLEQHTKAGGYMHGFSRFGHRFDTGAHYVGAMGEGQPFRVLLEYLNVYSDDLFVALDPEGFDVFRFPEFEVRFPQGYERMVSELSGRFPAECDAIRSFASMVRGVVERFPTYEFNDGHDTSPPVEALDTSLADVVRSLTRDSRLQCVLFAYCALHGVAPEDVPFGLHAIVLDSLLRGAYGFRQGGDGLTRAFVSRIEGNGGRVFTRKRVVQLETPETGDKRVSAVITEDGERFEGDWVISGIHPKPLLRMLGDSAGLTPAFRSRVEGLPESAGMLGIYAVCEREGFPLDPRRNYYFFASEDPAAIMSRSSAQVGDGRMERGAPGGDLAGIFASVSERLSEGRNPSQIAANLLIPAPIEHFQGWSGTRYGRRPEEYQAVKRAFTEKAFRLLERHLPGFQGKIIDHVTSSPLTNLHFNGSEKGSPYGIYHSIQNSGARSLGPRTKLMNLLLTGQNCLFPGLLGASVSALRTSGHIIGMKPVLKELKAGLQRARGSMAVAEP